MKKVNLIMWTALVGVVLSGCCSLSPTKLFGPPLTMKVVLEKTSFKRGETISPEIEIRNMGSTDAVLSYFTPVMSKPDLQSVASPDSRVSLNSQPTDGIPVAMKTLRIAGGTSTGFPGMNVHLRALQKEDNVLSGYYTELGAGEYYLTLKVTFKEADGSTWSGVLKTNPVIITVVE